ncbi:MAG TPA: galactosyltransferase-related protein [Thermoanaerobaculia bacterium]
MSLRQRIGALIYDWPLYRRMRRSGRWELMHNRDETIATDGRGVACEWEFTSDLHIAKVLPSAGAALMRMAFAQWPIVSDEVPERMGEPVISFVIGHRGVSRLPHLLATLDTIAGQREVAIECIVVEQDREPVVEKRIPQWVRYLFTPCESDYNRAAAFNAGVAAARGEFVVLHDNDILVPAGYAREVVARGREGFELMNLKRFLFHLERLNDRVPRSIMQNAQGGSIAASKRAYIDIGGYDDEFVGWGGEDNDFWDRARAHGNVYGFGYLPMIHLHHEAQKGKGDRAAPAVQRYYDIRSTPPEERITRLRERWRERAR